VYATPAVPADNDAGPVMVGAGLMVSVRVNLARLELVVEAWESPLESTIVNVIVKTPDALGVPLKTPPAEMLRLGFDGVTENNDQV
jgi:hypothetical protein